MAQLPVNRTDANTRQDHLNDHNEVHRLHNALDDSTATPGDLLIRGASGWTRLPKGTATHVLTQGATYAAWAAPTGGSGVGAVDDLTDVVITSVADNQVLTWDPGTSRWVNQTVAASDVTVISTTLAGVGTNVQAVFEELDNAIAAAEAAMAAHLADTAGAHAASAIATDGATPSTVQAELDDLYALSAAHLADTVDAHDASAISTTGATPSNVQTVLDQKADSANAALTGIPTVPLAGVATSTTQAASTSFVQQEINELPELSNGLTPNDEITFVDTAGILRPVLASTPRAIAIIGGYGPGVISTAAETTLLASLAMPITANTIQYPAWLEFYGTGYVIQNFDASETVTFRLKSGANTIWSSGAIVFAPQSASAHLFTLNIRMRYTLTASGTLTKITGAIGVVDLSTNVITSYHIAGTNATTTPASFATFDLTAQNSVSSALLGTYADYLRLVRYAV